MTATADDSATKLWAEKVTDDGLAILYLMPCLPHNNLNLFIFYYTANVPSFARLMDGIQKKKSRESMVLSVVIGILLCITIW